MKELNLRIITIFFKDPLIEKKSNLKTSYDRSLWSIFFGINYPPTSSSHRLRWWLCSNKQWTGHKTDTWMGLIQKSWPLKKRKRKKKELTMDSWWVWFVPRFSKRVRRLFDPRNKVNFRGHCPRDGINYVYISIRQKQETKPPHEKWFRRCFAKGWKPLFHFYWMISLS